ncbi:conjugative transposon protein TraN [Elizabethkingia anophelis]|uniref:conjugative transposon protein TraN n=1 Tax=Elizabethkingia anophelis TaxID=1117645 RepID=UPI001370700B|nr:conjugative transposon protein TraN [Elizabethkingia anophelis]MYY43964.1 conjugative transposon protein TraN [Elizabethkingia anophelis]
MKQILKAVLLLVVLIQTSLYAQSDSIGVSAPESVTSLPPYATINPKELHVTYEKTTHLLFPSAIRYVDLGSSYLVAGKADDAENVLRVKAAVKDFPGETNLSVITSDGHFYNFDVLYSEYPRHLNINLMANESTVSSESYSQNSGPILLKELGGASASLTQLVMEQIFSENKRIIRHIGSKSFGIQVLLKGIYTENGKLYFHIQYQNSSNIPFTVDFMQFKIVDKKVAKRTVIQEKLVEPLRNYNSVSQIAGMATERNVYLLDQITIADDKILLIEIFEKNGGRHQSLKIENIDLVKARLVKNLHLKF